MCEKKFEKTTFTGDGNYKIKALMKIIINFGESALIFSSTRQVIKFKSWFVSVGVLYHFSLALNVWEGLSHGVKYWFLLKMHALCPLFYRVNPCNSRISLGPTQQRVTGVESWFSQKCIVSSLLHNIGCSKSIVLPYGLPKNWHLCTPFNMTYIYIYNFVTAFCSTFCNGGGGGHAILSRIS